VAVLCAAGNLFVLWFSKGLVALDTLDFWVGTFLIFVVAGTQIICFAWVFGVDGAMALANEGALLRIPRGFRFVFKYVSPVYLLVIFVGFCWNNVPPYLRSLLGDPRAGQPPDHAAIYAWLVILASIGLLMGVTALGSRRWRQRLDQARIDEPGGGA